MVLTPCYFLFLSFSQDLFSVTEGSSTSWPIHFFRVATHRDPFTSWSSSPPCVFKSSLMCDPSSLMWLLLSTMWHLNRTPWRPIPRSWAPHHHHRLQDGLLVHPREVVTVKLWRVYDSHVRWALMQWLQKTAKGIGCCRVPTQPHARGVVYWLVRTVDITIMRWNLWWQMRARMVVYEDWSSCTY